MLLKFSQERAKQIGLCLLAIILIGAPLTGVIKEYYLHLLIMAGVNMILAISFLLMIAVGRITIGAAAFWGVGAYASALLVTNLGMSYWLALPITAVITGIIALLVGALILRAPGMAFVILTMVVNMVFVEAAGHAEFFGGWVGLMDIPPPNPIHLPWLGTLKFVEKLPYYYLMLFLLLLTVMATYALYRSRIGRAWNAIKLNERLAQTLGINVWKYRLLAFIISSIFAGIVGSFFAHYFQTLEPRQFTVFKSVYIQIYGILGGLNFYITGGAIGSLIMTFIPEFLRPFAEFEPIFTGILLIAIVVFLPEGVISVCHKNPSAQNASIGIGILEHLRLREKLLRKDRA